MTAVQPLPLRRQNLSDIAAQSERARMVVERIRDALIPATKPTPVLTALEIAQLCGVDKAKVTYRAAKGDLPEGELKGNRREWPLAEAQLLVRDLRASHMRPAGAAAVTIAVANFKGGVAKTTTAVTLAQGLSMRGHKVLLIDLDPQGSASTLFGVLPHSGVEAEETAMMLFAGDYDQIGYAVRETYWPGINLVCAAPLLFAAEFSLPARTNADPGFEFWKVLDRGLDEARNEYDVIILDTPPSLSYVTINALLAGDGILMPLPPSQLDFTSSASFWELFTDLTKNLVRDRGEDKTFEFIDILLSRVETQDQSSSFVRQWILEAYGDKVLPIEIPKTAATSTAAAEFGTIYDTKAGKDARTYNRARDAYDRMCELLEEQIESVWHNQIQPEGA